MKNFKYLFTGLFAVLFLAGCHHTGGSEGAENEGAGEMMGEKEMMEEGEMMEKEEMMEGAESKEMEKEMEGEAGEEMGYYVPYSEEKMTALAGAKKSGIFPRRLVRNVPKMGKNDWGSGRRTTSRVGNFES